MTQIVVSRRDGILRAPDGTRWRIARGKTLADARHPAVLANPGDWVPMEVTLTVEGADPAVGDSDRDTTLDELRSALEDGRNEQAELEETLAQRDAEFSRLVAGLAELGVWIPEEDDRRPGWLVDLALEAAGAGFNALKNQVSEPTIAPPKPRKRTAPRLAENIRPVDDAF